MRACARVKPESAQAGARRLSVFVAGLAPGTSDSGGGTDITDIRLQGGWLYGVASLAWYSRYVVSWELAVTVAPGFVQRAVEAAFGQAQPEILNAAQGSHFTSDWYGGRVPEQGVKISMDGKGRALANIFTERFWRP